MSALNVYLQVGVLGEPALTGILASLAVRGIKGVYNVVYASGSVVKEHWHHIKSLGKPCSSATGFAMATPRLNIQFCSVLNGSLYHNI